ncbi:DMT family transporter [Undibacterium sp. TJN19]|uniref:DMT family transporter n=1 Tax=Undibacterium sp. TJN19 TaxID=3413055 RepID=UPI003BF26AB0
MAIALAAAGVLSIVFCPDTNADSAHSLLGNSLVFGAVLCEGLFILLNKRIQTSIPPLAMSTLMTGMGLLAATILALFEPAWTGSITVNSLWAVAYYALIPTVLGFLLWYAGAQRVSGSEASLFTALAPVSAVLLAMTFLGEPVNSHQMTGIACVLVAVTGLGWSERKSMKP